MADENIEGFILDTNSTAPVAEVSAKEETPVSEEKPVEEKTTEEPAAEEKPVEEKTTEAPASEEKPAEEKTVEEPNAEASADAAFQTQLKSIMDDQKIDEAAALKVIEGNLNTETPESIAVPELMTQLANELGWKIEDEKEAPEATVTGLKNFMESIVRRNSAPKYGSPESEAFDRFTAAGGNPKLFWDTTYGTTDYSKLSIEDEAGQIKVVSSYLKEQHPDWDADKIHSKVETLKDKEMLEGEATDALPVLTKIDAERKAKLVIDKEGIRIAGENKIKSDDLAIRTHINSSQKIAGFDVADKEKDRFFEFMTTRDEDGKTGYVKLLNIEGTRLNLAFLAFRGIDAASLRQDVVTDVTSQTRQALQRFKAKTAGTTSTGAAPEIEKGQNAAENIDAFVFEQN